MEMVRGPGSALYGANAFSGVIDIRTHPARDVTGTKITLGGGSQGTIRGDLRHAGVLGQGRFGYRVNLGYYRSESWSLSRTALDGSDAAQEYSVADNPPTTGVPTCTGIEDCLAIESTPLAGQTRDSTSGIASGTADQIQNIYGSARLDYYLDNGSIFTIDGGAAQVQNELFVTGIGRVQVPKGLRPWARAAFAADKFNVSAWYSGRVSEEPQVSLSSGAGLDETSAIYHVEGQYDESFLGDEFRVVLGASFRNYNVDTKGTLMNTSDDNRSDNYYSGYGQLEWTPLDILKVVAAGRVDDGDLFKTQFSPKGAIVFTPSPQHAIRATINRAFMLPNYSEFFLQVQAGATPNPGALEGALNGYYATVQDPNVVGPQLAGLMAQLGLPSQVGWNFEAQTPVMALGNEALEPETVLGFELGYKGEFGRGYIGVDLYWNELDNFVTDLLFGVNGAQYPDFDLTQSSDPAADLAAIDAVLAGVGLPANHPLRDGNAELQSNLATLAGTPITDLNGTPSVWLSYAQAGEATERGVEFSAGYGFTPELRADVSYTFFDFEVKDPGLAQAGQSIVPNTPKNKGTIALSYTGIQGFDATIAGKFVQAFDWNAGVFAGRIPSSQLVDLDVGYRFRGNWRIFAAATNLLDQDLFQLYGGSVNGLRVLGGVTASF
jgi:iron complex outermembrane receptor protein